MTVGTGYLEIGFLYISYLERTGVCTMSRQEKCRLDISFPAIMLLACGARG